MSDHHIEVAEDAIDSRGGSASDADPVSAFAADWPQWQDGLLHLQAVIKPFGLRETVHRARPAYTHLGEVVVGLMAYPKYFGLWFPQGGLLADAREVLVNAASDATQPLRQWPMTSAEDICDDMVDGYVREALLLAKSDGEVSELRMRPPTIPPELQAAFDGDDDLKARFDVMPLSRRRDYADHIGTAQLPATRQRRLRRILGLINGQR